VKNSGTFLVVTSAPPTATDALTRRSPVAEPPIESCGVSFANESVELREQPLVGEGV